MSSLCDGMAYSNLEDFLDRKVAISPWTIVTQPEANQFAAVTRDQDPMHVDPVWAEANSPYGHTVVAGMHMLALLPILVRGHDFTISGVTLAMNYGFNRVRFISPLPIGSPFRNHITLVGVDRRPDGKTSIVTENRLELKENEKTVLSAEWVNLLWP